MNIDKIKLIIHNMELLLQSLKEEFGDSSEHVYEEIIPYLIEDDIDEYYSEEDDL